MFDYLQKFNSLPQSLRDQVSSPSAMATIADLEAKYKVDLAIIVMKVMTKSLSFANLPTYLSGEMALTPEAASQLIRDLKEKIFAPLANYLGLTSEMRAFDLDKDIEVMIKAAGLVLPSAVAVSRFKNIISTYARGVRSKIDTRNTLAKDVKIGGLNLSAEEINRVLKICDINISKGMKAIPSAPIESLSVVPSRLDSIISGAEKKSVSAPSEYNLKEALAKGQTKPMVPRPLDTKHEIAQAEAQLDLPKPNTQATTNAPAAPKTPVTSIPKLTPIIPIPPVARSFAPIPPSAPASVAPARIINNPNPKIIKPVSSPASHLEALRHDVPIAPVAPKAAPVAPVSPAAARNLAGRQAPAPSDARPQMHDIKPMPKIMGPIEELQFLDLVNFRRLGATPAEMTAKVYGKIKLLEKDGYDKMVAGVRAWRQSPASRLYLRLGQEAIAKGSTLKGVIDARQAAGQEYLSMEEIGAIVSLNSKLVF